MPSLDWSVVNANPEGIAAILSRLLRLSWAQNPCFSVASVIKKFISHFAASRKQRVIVGLAACLVIANVAFVLWPRERQPVYEGKTLSEWLLTIEPVSPQRVIDSGDEAKVAEAVQHMGTNALPFLLKWIAYEPPRWKSTLLRQYGKLPQTVKSRLMRNDSFRTWMFDWYRPNSAALRGFAKLGEAASPAIPQLTRLLDSRSPEVARSAISALLSIGDAGLPPLLGWLRATTEQPPPPVRLGPWTSNAGVAPRVYLVRTLGIGRWNRTETIPCLIHCDNEQDIDVANVALWSLFNLRSSAGTNDLIGPIAHGLEHSRSGIRDNAAHILKLCGKEAQPAIPGLTRALNDSDATVRSEAKEALAVIGTNGQQSVDVKLSGEN